MTAYTATVDLPPAARSIAAARTVVAELLRAWAAEHYVADAALLLSELVTNVVRHVDADACLVVRVDLTAPGLRVSVADASPSPPRVRGAPTRPGGHGLILVAALASRWGVDELPAGKQVWFELGTR